jgi:hypothetical protein
MQQYYETRYSEFIKFVVVKIKAIEAKLQENANMITANFNLYGVLRSRVDQAERNIVHCRKDSSYFNGKVEYLLEIYKTTTPQPLKFCIMLVKLTIILHEQLIRWLNVKTKLILFFDNLIGEL